MAESELTGASEAAHVVWTVGHSTRPVEELIAILQRYEVDLVCDVRRFAGSRRNPQYAPAALAESLREVAVSYHSVPELGGRRKPKPDSPNAVWRNEAFRGYADYMETAEFADALAGLIEISRTQSTAILCSEAVWWRCHRSMIADALKARGLLVRHIMSPSSAPEHPWTAPARLEHGKLTYRS